MNLVEAISLTSAVNDWLINTRQPRILHVFDRACNLINEHKEVLSIVTPEIGNGPFNLVVETDILFSKHLSIESAVSASSNHLALGDLKISTAKAKLWNTKPDWDSLHSKRDDISKQLTQLPIAIPEFYNPLVFPLSSALAAADISTAKVISSKLAGLGQGLTPSGDDFIIGALHAAWILHPPEIASDLAGKIAETAAPLTTSLSAAWIRSVGRGEAGELWHQYFDALISGDEIEIQKRVKNILAVGETSGADALAGFVGVFLRARFPGSSPAQVP